MQMTQAKLSSRQLKDVLQNMISLIPYIEDADELHDEFQRQIEKQQILSRGVMPCLPLLNKPTK